MAGMQTDPTVESVVKTSQGLLAAGTTFRNEDETRGAWNYARKAGYTEATGLGQDRLTEAGIKRARER